MQWWAVARSQGGVISLVQLRESAVSADRIDGMVRRGELVVVLPGVYRAGPTPLTVAGRRYAAALWSNGAVSFQTAGTMWNMGTPAVLEVVDVSVEDRVSRNGHPGFVRVHRVILGPEDITVVDGLPVTTRSRTALDLVGTLPRRRARDLFERGFQQGWFTLEDLDRRLEREKGRAGNVRLREFREEIAPGAQAEFERRFHKLLRAHDITGWVAQYPITTVTGGLVHADIAFPEQRLLIELDGWATHRLRFGADRKRDRRTMATGWRTARYVWRDLDTADETIAEIRHFLAI